MSNCNPFQNIVIISTIQQIIDISCNSGLPNPQINNNEICRLLQSLNIETILLDTRE